MSRQPTWKVFALDNCGCIDWYVARSKSEAVDLHKTLTGEPLEPGTEVYEESDEFLEKTKYEDPDGSSDRTFADELARMLAEGIDEPVLLASTEY